MTAFALVVSVLVLIGPGSPRSPSPDAQVALAASPEQADSVAAEAYRLFADRSTWDRAARLLEKAARMRGGADVQRSAEYRAAARLYSHLDDLGAARRAFQAAAEAAAERGAVSEAAHAYLDAATAASLSGDRAAAQELIERGALLSNSPYLDAGERAAILRRIPVRLAAGG